MRVQQLWARLRQKRTLRTAGMITAIVAVFSLGVMFGNGHLRIAPLSRYSDQTGLPHSLDYSSLNQIYDAMENLIDERAAERKWEDRERIGFKK